MSIGQEMYDLCDEMFPICRSITGEGVRKTLNILKSVYTNMKVYEVPSGTQVFDWTVPREWNIKDATIENSKGEKIIDFKKNNLHVMGYSLPIDKIVSLEELKKIIYTQPDQPDVVPYVTSYYKERYGFCMSDNQKNSLIEDDYRIFIDSELKNGSLTYGEIIIPGESEQEVFLSTYICHPSMANNELSGPSVAIHLARWLYELPKRRYTYRIIFIPETIGSITYLSRNFDIMKKNIIAGWNLSCVGDDRTFSYVESRYGNTLADKITKNVLQFYYPEYKKYSFLHRGSDERQYNAPGIDLPVCAICRSKYGEYPEYHTSKDNMEVISPSGLQGAYEVYQQCIEALEYNAKYQIQCLCEPQLGKRGLYPMVSQKGSYDAVKTMTDFIAYADGMNDLVDISNIIGVSVKKLIPVVKKLMDKQLIKKIWVE
jgi:aminopeptidase-like protein